MKFFVDSADLAAIKKYNDYGIVDGVTTNPSIIAKAVGASKHKDVIAEICKIVAGPVSAEVIATDYDGMITEGLELAKIAKNVCVKLPTTFDGIKACKHLTALGISTNLTLCFSLPQAIMVAKAGATFVSPFIGRWDDICVNGIDLIRDIKTTYNNYGFKTQVLAASIRHPVHIVECAKIGADVATIPTDLFDKLIKHPLTTQGIDKFLSDWKSANAL